MTENERLAEAAMLLSKNCEVYDVDQDTGECIDSNGKVCLFCEKFHCCLYGVPNSWKIPRPLRFTDADVELASALQKFGACIIRRNHINQYCCALIVKGEDEVELELPEEAFKSVRENESVDINYIIKERKG